MPTLLLVTDRKTTIDAFHENLDESFFRLRVAAPPRAAFQEARSSGPDLIVLDGASGTMLFPHCIRTMQRLIAAPLIGLLRAGDAIPQGLTSYLVRPYTHRQLHDCLATTMGSYPRVLSSGPFALDLRTRQLTCPHLNQAVPLNPKLFALVRLFLEHPDELISREQLMWEVWETTFMQDTRTLDVHIRWVREILDPPGSVVSYLQTQRGRGYRLRSLSAT